MAYDPTLDPYLVGEERAAALATAALAEVSRPFGGGLRSLRLSVVLSLSETVPGARPSSTLLATLLRTPLREHLGEPSIHVAQGGAGASVAPFANALSSLERRDVDAVLFGGVHTDYEPTNIHALHEAGRLFTPKNIDALIPGESAAFVLVAHRDLATRLGLAPMARIHGTGLGQDESTAYDDASGYRAKGLSAAVRAATKDLPSEMKVGWAICDHTFEARRIYEWQAMMTRTREAWCEPMATDAPAQRIGHLGGAALPLSLVLASEAFVRGYAAFPLCLCFAGSDGGARGSILVGNA
jgi:3-oxoacyl-[acyl-carrier-protein] synthase-1